MGRLIDTYEAAALLGVTPGRVRQLAAQGRLTRQGAEKRRHVGRPVGLWDAKEVRRLAATRRAA